MSKTQTAAARAALAAFWAGSASASVARSVSTNNGYSAKAAADASRFARSNPIPA